jgi:hypothetical protein
MIINEEIRRLMDGLIKTNNTDTAKMIELKSKVQALQTLNDTEQLKFLFDRYVTWQE